MQPFACVFYFQVSPNTSTMNQCMRVKNIAWQCQTRTQAAFLHSMLRPLTEIVGHNDDSSDMEVDITGSFAKTPSHPLWSHPATSHTSPRHPAPSHPLLLFP